MRRVIIADDHPVIYKGLKEILQENFGGVMVDEAGTGRELLEKIKRNDYDLLLLDIALPDANGLDVLSDLRKKRPKLPVLVISMYPDEVYAVRALRTGAQGYLTKRSASEELVMAVRRIVSGKRYVNPAFALRMVVDFETDTARPAHEKLSNREFQVMRMFGSGKTVKDIANELSLSINSIRTYRVRIMEKIGVKGTEGLIRYVLTHGLTDYRDG